MLFWSKLCSLINSFFLILLRTFNFVLSPVYFEWNLFFFLGCFDRGIMYKGDSFQTVPNVMSEKRCQAICTGMTKCKYWTYRQTDSACDLKESLIKKLANKTTVSSGPKYCCKLFFCNCCVHVCKFYAVLIKLHDITGYKAFCNSIYN